MMKSADTIYSDLLGVLRENGIHISGAADSLVRAVARDFYRGGIDTEAALASLDKKFRPGREIMKELEKIFP